MKKSILFCCYGLGIGGIEKCMISLLNMLDTERYDIDVLPMNPEYAMLDSLRANVRLLEPFDYVMNTTDTAAAFRERGANVLDYGKYALFRVVNKWGKKPWRLFRAPEKVYDIAIAYAHTGYVPYYVIDRVRAKKKYMWHHEGRYIKDSRYPLDREYYPKFDAVIPVSLDDGRVLEETFPELRGHFRVLYNVVDREEIRAKAAQDVGYEDDPGVLKLTTVGRLTEQKGPDILLEAAQLLKDRQIPFVWYWVGGGNLEDWLRQESARRGLDGCLRLMGNRSNPYPYIAGCDIYVQPSRYEAYCTTTLEAQALEKPIVVTDVCGMREQFTDGEDGILTPIDSSAIAGAIVKLCEHPEMRRALSSTLAKKAEGNSAVLERYYQLFEES